MSKLSWKKDSNFIWGKELLINELNYENKNEIDTLEFIQKNSKFNLKEQFNEIGSALSLLSQIASCAWGCSGGNHLRENMVRRLTNYFFATIRLANLGLYNEAFSLIRSAGELANLIKLFSFKEEEFEKWSQLDSKERWDNYKPEKIRSKLESYAIQEVMNKETYSELCGVAIHPSVEFALMSHQQDGGVFIGTEFSEETVAIIYNELTSILAEVLHCVGNFVKADLEHMKILNDASEALIELKKLNLSLVTYLKGVEKDGFAKLSLDSSKTDEFLQALSKHSIYFILTNKPKKLLEIVKEKGSASVTIYSIYRNHRNIIPIFTTERKAKSFLTTLSIDDQRICREMKLIIMPLLEQAVNATIVLNYGTSYEREITGDEIDKIKLLSISL